ncbi:MAG: ABC transporter permease [Ignavibacteriales bacterium]|nr:ABC transporter permease [Ignavibacteriales bacterium]
MSLPLFLTRKYLRTRKDSRFLSVISSITIIGIAIGVAVVIIALTVLDGFENVVSEKITNFNSHIKVTGFGSRNLPSQLTVIPELQKQYQNNFTRIQPFVSKLVIIKSKKMTEGITLTGIEPGSNSELNEFIQTGSFNLQNDSGLPKIILGKTLSEKLLIKVGETVTIFSLKNDQSPSQENPPAIEQFYVSGIYESGMSEYDDLNAFVNFSTAQKMFGMGDLVSGYNIKVKELSGVNLLADQLQDFLGYPYYVRTIFQVNQNIFTWIDLQKEPIPIVLGLIIFVAVFNIVGTLLMIVLERTNSVGILRSLGANRKLIMKTFLLHAMYLIVIGVLIGNLLALVLTLLQQRFDIISLPDKIYFVTHVPISIELKNYLLVTAVTIAVSLIASMLPAVIASKIKPISAIRFE